MNLWLRQLVFWKYAAQKDAFEQSNIETSEALDMAVCCYPSCMFHFDGHTTNFAAVS